MNFNDSAVTNNTPTSDVKSLSFVDEKGQKIPLTTFLGKQRIVLTITRGSVCTYCAAQTHALAEHSKEFERRNAALLIVVPGPNTKAFIKKAVKNDRVPLLMDEELIAIDALGIRGDLSKPATYIIDKKGNTVFAYVGTTSADRPSIKAILAQLDKLQD